MRLVLLLTCLVAVSYLVAAAPCATNRDALDTFFKYVDTDGDARVSHKEFDAGIDKYVNLGPQYRFLRVGGVDKVMADCATGPDKQLAIEDILSGSEMCKSSMKAIYKFMKAIYKLVDCPI